MPFPIVSAQELSSRLGSVVLVDARPGDDAYATGHLKGAMHLDLDRDLSLAKAPGHDAAKGGRHPLPTAEAFAAQVGSWGIGADDDVVIYDGAGGANAAARLWWMLRSLGHDRVQVLDGGFAAAVAAGIPTTVEVPKIQARSPHPQKGWQWPTVDAKTVERIRTSADRIVLDVRSSERYRGETEPFDPVKGHIPGAKNLFFGENLQKDGRFKSEEELRAMYERFLGGMPVTSLVVHCGSGVTACHTLLALDAAGMPGAALYVGSWSEWCRNPWPQATGA